MKKRLQEISINPDASVLYALKYMDETERKLLLVIEKDNFIGLLSIGDIQRAIIRNIDLKDRKSVV